MSEFHSQWFRKQRVLWIKEMITIYGFINREHIMRKFDISIAQAALDIAEVLREEPNLMRYDKSAKRYVIKEEK